MGKTPAGNSQVASRESQGDKSIFTLTTSGFYAPAPYDLRLAVLVQALKESRF